MKTLLFLSIVSPLFTSIIAGFYGYRLKKHIIGWISSGGVFLSFIFLLVLYIKKAFFEMNLFEWTNIPFKINILFLSDRLSILMGLIVACVSFIVHVYSIYYMEEDEGYFRFFSYLNLFVFSMLVLVLAGNLIVMFIGWEGVGLCSYLLIGFWYYKESASKAGVKAFVVNRIGDAGFLLGIFSILFACNTLEFNEIKNLLNTVDPQILIFAGIFLFIGAIGKSAQFPLYIWLPDAMEGPTPVSALIHAATMVTAGVYMVLRLSFLYSLIPEIGYFIALIGSLTAFYSALCAVKEDDLKRILAYSTISQLGYMFAGAGLSFYGKGFFHLITHAFFKALLFLTAGIIMHSLNGEINIKRMGGLLKKLKHTHLLFAIGALSLSAIPPFGSYFSKEGIIHESLNAGYLIYFILVLTSFLTSLYIFRAYFHVFQGHEKVKPHKEDKRLVYPSYILAFFAIISGFFNFRGHIDSIFGKTEIHLHIPFILSLLPLIFSIAGILSAWYFYDIRKEQEKGFIFELIENKFYFDKILSVYFVNVLFKISGYLEKFLELRTIDRIVNGAGKISLLTGKIGISLQRGSLRFYLKLLFAFISLLIFFFMFRYI